MEKPEKSSYTKLFILFYCVYLKILQCVLKIIFISLIIDNLLPSVCHKMVKLFIKLEVNNIRSLFYYFP